ncbi:MAG: hypothetical protein J6R77_08025, partial [Clostridia bacterium]|nr:hypothetical protein [Clostridia bacterium]
SRGVGITTKNLVMNGSDLDVTGTTRALLLTGNFTVKSGLSIQAATTTTGTLSAYNSANIASYKRVYVTNHTCSGGTATCQTLAKCTTCGQSYGKYGAHVWSKTWDMVNAAGHAHKCTVSGCTAKDSLGKHTPGPAATETSAQTCTTCNYIIAPKLNHVHSTKKVAAVNPLCEKNGNVEYYTCTGCSKIFRDAAATKEFDSLLSTISPALGHKYAETWSMNATEHWHACAACGKRDGVEKHIPGPEATETSDQTCIRCNYVIKKAVSHTHAYGTHWFSDGSDHWKACACGAVSEKAAHVDKNADQVCDKCDWALANKTPATDPTTTTDATDNNNQVTDTTTGDDQQTDATTGDNKEQNDKQEDNADQGGSSTLIIVVCILAAVLLAAVIVLVVILVKRKKQ